MALIRGAALSSALEFLGNVQLRAYLGCARRRKPPRAVRRRLTSDANIVGAALRELGSDGVAEIIGQSCATATAIVNGLGSLPLVDVLWKPVLNQGLVRFLDPRDGASEADHDARTEAVIAAIVRQGDVFSDRRRVRCVDRVVAAVRAVL